jgi:hypothetical protein
LNEASKFKNSFKKETKRTMELSIVTFLLLSFTTIAAILLIFIPSLTYAQNNTSGSSVQPNASTIALRVDNMTFPIRYQITNGDQVKSVSLEKQKTTLLLNISSNSNGKLIIELPRNVIDSKNPGNVDDKYVVFIDEQNIPVDEVKNSNQTRTLTIPFDKGSSVIEIAGTQVMPEFGPINGHTLAISLVAGIAIIGIMIANNRYNRSSRNYQQTSAK